MTRNRKSGEEERGGKATSGRIADINREKSRREG